MKQKYDYSAKPYNRCLSCTHRSEHRCDGPRSSAMALSRWCEFMRDMKNANGLTNEEVAQRSGVSIKTIESIMGLKREQDVMRETARLIEDAIIGSSNQYPCFLAFEEAMPDKSQQLTTALTELERALADNKDYRTALDNIHASYNAEMQLIREDAQNKISYLLGEIERARADAEHWRQENERKGKFIDRYMEKIV